MTKHGHYAKGGRNGSAITRIIADLTNQCTETFDVTGKNQFLTRARAEQALFTPFVNAGGGFITAATLPYRRDGWILVDVRPGGVFRVRDAKSKKIVLVVTRNPPELAKVVKRDHENRLSKAGQALANVRTIGPGLGEVSVDLREQPGEAFVWGPSANAGKVNEEPKNQKVKMIKWNLTKEGKKWFEKVKSLAQVMDEVFQRLLPEEFEKQRKIVEGLPEDLRIALTAFAIYEIGISKVTEQHRDLGNVINSWCSIMSFSDKDEPTAGGHQVYPQYGIILKTPPGTVLYALYHEVDHANLLLDQPFKPRKAKPKKISQVGRAKHRAMAKIPPVKGGRVVKNTQLKKARLSKKKDKVVGKRLPLKDAERIVAIGFINQKVVQYAWEGRERPE